MNFTLKTSLFATLTIFSQHAFAWGSTAHRSIGLIAEQHMSLSALKKAQAILNGHNLSYVANWADEIRSEPKTYGYTFDWHYTTWQDDDEQLAVLKNPASSQAEKAFALKFVVHLLGDLHQPLHVGGGNDKGGNACRVTWHGKPSNLHTVWDSELVDRMNLSYTELAEFSSQARTQQQTKQWQSGAIETWAQESKMLRRKIYPAEVQAPNSPVTYLTYCQDNVAPEAMPKLGYEYSYQFDQILRDRLYQAGVRLAKVLNETL
jgi:S1/P1 Nuclease